MKLQQLFTLPTTAAVALLCTPLATCAQSILLSAGDFTVLAGTAVSSTGADGTTVSNGDLGVSPGSSVSGFPPAAMSNGAIIATGPATEAARNDLITVQTALALMPVTSILSNVDLGGKTLESGVYKFDAAGSQDGELVLDAQFQNGAYWVFNFGTTFSAAAGSSVTFINLGSNLGSDLGLFWNAGSDITFGANNQIAGNYLAGTSITFGNQSSGAARALALAAVMFDQTVIDAFGGPAGGDFSGGLEYAPGGDIVATAIPEPSAVLWATPLAALGFALRRRARGVAQAA